MVQKVYVKMGLDCPYSSSLYYLLREFDKDGQGWVKLPMSLLQNLLNIKRRALKERLEKCVSNAFIYTYEISNGNLYVKYVSLNVLKSEVYTDNFASVKLNGIDLLDINKFKECLYGAAINRQQQASEKAISKTEKSSRKIINPYKYIDSNYTQGCVYRNKDKLFIKSYINVAGASQITLAEYLDKSRSTLIKWCNKFSSLKIWKKKKCLSANPGPDIYEITKQKKNGVKYKVQYKRMPNYYFVNIEAKAEKKLLHKTIYSPAMLYTQLEASNSLIEENIKAALNGKNNPGKTLTEKLTFWFKKDQLVNLTINFLLYLKGVEVPTSHFNQFTAYQIAEAIDLTVPKLEAAQLDVLLLMIHRLKKKLHPYPPYLLLNSL